MHTLLCYLLIHCDSSHLSGPQVSPMWEGAGPDSEEVVVQVLVGRDGDSTQRRVLVLTPLRFQ